MIICHVLRSRFINARRRILQPMLDASNPDPAPKAKKMKSQHRPTQRFWPDSIVAGVLQTHRSQTGNNSDSMSTNTNISSFSYPTLALDIWTHMWQIFENWILSVWILTTRCHCCHICSLCERMWRHSQEQRLSSYWKKKENLSHRSHSLDLNIYLKQCGF